MINHSLISIIWKMIWMFRMGFWGLLRAIVEYYNRHTHYAYVDDDALQWFVTHWLEVDVTPSDLRERIKGWFKFFSCPWPRNGSVGGLDMGYWWSSKWRNSRKFCWGKVVSMEKEIKEVMLGGSKDERKSRRRRESKTLTTTASFCQWPSQILLRIVGIRGKRGGIKQIRGTRSNRLFMDI